MNSKKKYILIASFILFLSVLFQSCLNIRYSRINGYYKGKKLTKKSSYIPISVDTVRGSSETLFLSTKLENAPIILNTIRRKKSKHTDDFDVYDMAYIESGCASPWIHCLFDFDVNKALNEFDYLFLKNSIEEKLENNKIQIAFSGYSSGEIFITTMIKKNKYYQIRLVVDMLNDRKSQIYGGVNLIKLEQGNHFYRFDGFCRKIEKSIIDNIWENINRP